MPHFAGVVMLLRELDRQARREGGALFMLNGNHESLNVCGDFRCLPSPWSDFGPDDVWVPRLSIDIGMNLLHMLNHGFNGSPWQKPATNVAVIHQGLGMVVAFVSALKGTQLS